MYQLTQVLQDIKDMVIVTGSFAAGTCTSESDIDLYIKPLPEDEIDYDKGIDTYCERLMKYFRKRGFNIDSCGPLTFAIRELPIMLDFSALFEVDLDNAFEATLFGVPMVAAKSTYAGLDR